MAYRDDLDAARTRAETLAREVDRLTAEREADDRETLDLRERLGKAERELVRLQGLTAPKPPRSMRPWNVVLGLGGLCVVATLVAAYGSESDGVAVSHVAGAVLGAGVGGRMRGLVGALAGAAIVLALLVGFYAAIWPAL